MPKKIEEGLNAPKFKLLSTDNQYVKLSDFKGKKNVVLYFYPKDNTPGCTQEACGFRDSNNDFLANDVVILGISFDDANSHKKFTERYDLPFALLCDLDKKVARDYEVYAEKTMFGKKKMGIMRSTFIIDKKGIIKKIYRKVKVDGHIEDVLKYINDNL
jgi:peroxiredoxin Q/BCP